MKKGIIIAIIVVVVVMSLILISCKDKFVEEPIKCANSGEPINPPQLQGKTNYANVCCEGLKGVNGYYINEKGECEILVGNPYLWCVPCGNGVCDKFESIEEHKCSCPADCQ